MIDRPRVPSQRSTTVLVLLIAVTLGPLAPSLAVAQMKASDRAAWIKQRLEAIADHAVNPARIAPTTPPEEAVGRALLVAFSEEYLEEQVRAGMPGAFFEEQALAVAITSSAKKYRLPPDRISALRVAVGPVTQALAPLVPYLPVAFSRPSQTPVLDIDKASKVATLLDPHLPSDNVQVNPTERWGEVVLLGHFAAQFRQHLFLILTRPPSVVPIAYVGALPEKLRARWVPWQYVKLEVRQYAPDPARLEWRVPVATDDSGRFTFVASIVPARGVPHLGPMVFEPGPGVSAVKVSPDGRRVEVSAQAPAALFFGYRPPGMFETMPSEGRLIHFVAARTEEDKSVTRLPVFLVSSGSYGVNPPPEAPGRTGYALYNPLLMDMRQLETKSQQWERLRPSLAGVWKSRSLILTMTAAPTVSHRSDSSTRACNTDRSRVIWS